MAFSIERYQPSRSASVVALKVWVCVPILKANWCWASFLRSVAS